MLSKLRQRELINISQVVKIKYSTKEFYSLKCNLLALDNEAVLDYLHYLKDQHKTPSESYIKHTVYGLRYLYRIYEKVESRDILSSIERPKKLLVVTGNA